MPVSSSSGSSRRSRRKRSREKALQWGGGSTSSEGSPAAKRRQRQPEEPSSSDSDNPQLPDELMAAPVVPPPDTDTTDPDPPDADPHDTAYPAPTEDDTAWGNMGPEYLEWYSRTFGAGYDSGYEYPPGWAQYYGYPDPRSRDQRDWDRRSRSRSSSASRRRRRERRRRSRERRERERERDRERVRSMPPRPVKPVPEGPKLADELEMRLNFLVANRLLEGIDPKIRALLAEHNPLHAAQILEHFEAKVRYQNIKSPTGFLISVLRRSASGLEVGAMQVPLGQVGLDASIGGLIRPL